MQVCHFFYIHAIKHMHLRYWLNWELLARTVQTLYCFRSCLNRKVCSNIMWTYRKVMKKHLDKSYHKNWKSYFQLQVFLKQKLFSRWSQIFIYMFYLHLSYTFQMQRLKRYRARILRISKKTILIEIFRIDFQ